MTVVFACQKNEIEGTFIAQDGKQTLFFAGCCLFIYVGFNKKYSKFDTDSEHIYF